MGAKKIDKVIIANRGEIAVRVIQACKELGIKTVALYSEADKKALHVLHADEQVCLGPAAALNSYLKIPQVLAAAEITHASAVHPGYGFLSENADFARICEESGLSFIGPSYKTIQLLGDKAKAKELAKSVKCPVVPGTDGIVEDLEEAIKEARKIGFPVVIKAVAGGGGKGIRIVEKESDFENAFNSAKSEAEVSFNNPDVYIEKMIVNPRHIEVQILADKHGNCIHLGERDCTMQRRRQKLIEEAPSPVLDASMRKKVGAAAVNLVKAAGYHSAGTVEFLLDENGHFYFMEVNTRIQVEHTVTEELSGVDLVREMLRIEMGEKLPLRQKDVQLEGHVIECRINAENPDKNFMPSPGKVEWYLPPGGRGVRVDSACYSGYQIPPYYDSMVAKLIVKGSNREEAIAKMRRALSEFHIGGIHSTIPFHQHMMQNEDFIDGKNYNINYVDRMLENEVSFVLEEV